MVQQPSEALPVVVIGAGPVGLAAAAELVLRGERPRVLEMGPGPGAAVREWGHVRLFSPWRHCLDGAGRRLLEAGGWRSPDLDAFPTGQELVERYLQPLAELPELRGALAFNSRVAAVLRAGMDRLTSRDRERQPFEVRVETPSGGRTLLARAVIDASGTWRTPNPLGSDGLAAGGEARAAGHLHRGLPDVRGILRHRFAGRRVALVGRGHSAFNVLLELRALQEDDPRTEVTWAVRKQLTGDAFGGSEDGLPERARLGERVRSLLEGSAIRLLEGFAVAEVTPSGEGVTLGARDGRRFTVDEVVSATGFRPDHSLTTELRLRLDEVVEAPAALAPLIDPNLHSCGTVPPHGEAELAHPERGYYAVGMKSYGRAPTFLMLTGYEQVRSIASALTGDWVGARRVELVLPETGVCSTAPLAGVTVGGHRLNVLAAAAACCAPERANSASSAADPVLPKRAGRATRSRS